MMFLSATLAFSAVPAISSAQNIWEIGKLGPVESMSLLKRLKATIGDDLQNARAGHQRPQAEEGGESCTAPQADRGHGQRRLHEPVQRRCDG